MGCLERAFLSVSRKRGKSVLLFLILLIVTTFVLVGVSMKRAAETAAQELRHSLGGSFGMVINKAISENFRGNQASGMEYCGSPLNRTVIEKMLKVPGIEGCNASLNGEVIPVNDSGAYLKLIKTNDKYDDDETLLHMAASESTTYSEKSRYFQNGTFELTEGRHITENDRNAAMVSKELAGLNHLQTGQKMILQTKDGGKFSNLTIVGIFEIKEPQLNTGLVPPPSLYQNLIITDITMANMFFDKKEPEYQRLEFYVCDPAQIDKIIERAKETVDIAWEDFSVEAADTQYRKTAAPLENMSSLMSTLLLCLTAGSTLILSLILSLCMRSRIHETGVLLAMGVRKIQVFIQYLVEVLMIAVLAFAISFFAGQVVANTAGDILTQSMTDQPESSVQSKTASIIIEITVEDFIVVCVLGTGTVIASVGLSSIPVFCLKPKQILSQMS